MARTRTRNTANNQEKKAVVSDAVNAEANNGVSERKDRPTPKRSNGGGGGNGIISRIPIVRGIVGYFRGVASEMQKVTWPSREEATRLTSVVMGVTIAFAITLGLMDAFYAWWFRQAFKADSELLFLGIAAALFVAIGGGFLAIRNRV